MNRKEKIILISLASALILSSCAVLASCGSSGGKYSTKDYEYKTELSSSVTKVLNTTDEKFLILANKENVLGEDHAPQKTASLDPSYTAGGKSVELEESVAVAVIAMIDEMRALGYKSICVTSGYRTFKRQTELFNGYMATEKQSHPQWSDDKIKDAVLAYSALPGTSEHQTGLCVDLWVDGEMADLVNYGSETPKNKYDKGFAETDEFLWLRDNAHKFGFILRYPEDKTSVTGYDYESWHYRFVGVSAASEIYNEKITFEEYIGR